MERDWYKIIKNGIENGAINTSYNDSVPFNDILEYYEKQYGIYINPFQMPDSEKAFIEFEYKRAQQESRKNSVRLTESQLHKVIKESVKKVLNEMSPELAARYEGGRQAQADNASTEEARYKYQQKANAGKQYAHNAWNNQFGFNFNNGEHHWGHQEMGGNNNFTHNGDSKYGVNFRGEQNNWDGDGYTHTNMAYNPKQNTLWQGDGRGNSTVKQPQFDYGDNGYRTAQQMEKGSQEVYNKYRNK